MAMIYVRAKEGRKLFYEGRIIPSDKFIPVTDDPYIRRLVHHWGDLDLQEGSADQAKNKAPSKSKQPQEASGGKVVQPPPYKAPGTGAPPNT